MGHSISLFKMGSFVYRAGDEASDFCVVLSGSLSIHEPSKSDLSPKSRRRARKGGEDENAAAAADDDELELNPCIGTSSQGSPASPLPSRSLCLLSSC